MPALAEFSLDGRAALVTGAGGGIGATVARAFARAGAAVLVTDVDEAAAQLAAEQIVEAGGTAEHRLLILNVTSAAGLVGTIGQADYGAAKAGIIGLTKSLVKELARKHVTVNALAPLAATAMTEGIRGGIHHRPGAARRRRDGHLMPLSAVRTHPETAGPT